MNWTSLLLHVHDLLIQVSLLVDSFLDGGGAGAGLLPGALVGHVHHVAALVLQLLEDLVLSGLRQVLVELLNLLAGLHDDGLLGGVSLAQAVSVMTHWIAPRV